MTGTISVLSFSERRSSAALVGSFAGDNAAFLAKHLEELAGDVLLECEHLDDLDAAGARVLHTFRENRDRQGFRVFFRGLQPRCREQLLDQARGMTVSQPPTRSAARASQPVFAGSLTPSALSPPND